MVENVSVIIDGVNYVCSAANKVSELPPTTLYDFKQGVVIGLIVLVVLLVILALIVGFNKLKGNEDEPSLEDKDTYY